VIEAAAVDRNRSGSSATDNHQFERAAEHERARRDGTAH
jgi:hypothetical protein